MGRQVQKMAAEPTNKIEYAFQLYNKVGTDGKRLYSVEEIAAALEISPRTVRGYIYRCRRPDKFKEIVARYFAKKRAEAAPAAEEPKQKTAKIPAAPIQKPIPKWKAPSKAPGKAKASKIEQQIDAEAKQAAEKARATVARVQAETEALKAPAAKIKPFVKQKK